MDVMKSLARCSASFFVVHATSSLLKLHQTLIIFLLSQPLLRCTGQGLHLALQRVDGVTNINQHVLAESVACTLEHLEVLISNPFSFYI